jgi:hypothetical protein
MSKLLIALIVLTAGAAQAKITSKVYLRTRDSNLVLETKNTKNKSGQKYVFKSCKYRHTVLFLETEKRNGFKSARSWKQTRALTQATAKADNDVNEMMKYVSAGKPELMSKPYKDGKIDLEQVAENSKNPKLKTLATRMIDNIRKICPI